MKFYKLKPIALIVLLGIGSVSSHATEYVQGSVLSDKVLYQIGGGSAVLPPPSRSKPNEYGISLGWKGDFMCGNFDLKTTVKNQLNGITEGFKDLYGNIIQSATGAVASLPAMIIQRANPQLYDILTNGLYQAKIDFDNLKTSCEEMSQTLADFTLDNKWEKAAKLESWKDIISSESDAKKAKKKSEDKGGKDGIIWVGGQKKGGIGQDSINVLFDVVEAGFNISQGRKALDKSSISKLSCDGRMCTTWQKPEDAAVWVRDVLGDSVMSTCDNCGDKPKSSRAGMGLSPKIEDESIAVMTQFEKILNSNAITQEQLSSISSTTIPITRGLIEALKEDPDAVVIATKLSNEIGLSRVLEKALIARRMMIAGMREPNVYQYEPAREEIEKNLAALDREIDQVKMELELQKELGNSTAITALNNRLIEQQRALNSNSSDSVTARLVSLDQLPPEENGTSTSAKTIYAQNRSIILPIPNSTGGLSRINGTYSNYGRGGSDSSSSISSLKKYESKNAYADGRATIYKTPDGRYIRREGGTLAWRNNNPGNIRAGEFAQANGAIGVGPSGFAIFPDEATGTAALTKLLAEGRSYRNNTVAGSIAKYAPPNENNTQAYIERVTKALGVPGNTKMKDLTIEQRQKMVDTIRNVEGWKVGSERENSIS